MRAEGGKGGREPGGPQRGHREARLELKAARSGRGAAPSYLHSGKRPEIGRRREEGESWLGRKVGRGG